MNNILKRYSLKELKNDIRKYGFNYATKDFIIESFFIILAVLVIAFISHLRYQYILILISISILLIPFIIHAWFKQNYNIKNLIGTNEIVDNFNGIMYSINNSSFMQVNNDVCLKLYL